MGSTPRPRGQRVLRNGEILAGMGLKHAQNVSADDYGPNSALDQVTRRRHKTGFWTLRGRYGAKVRFRQAMSSASDKPFSSHAGSIFTPPRARSALPDPH
jgi:hypothetical protein